MDYDTYWLAGLLEGEGCFKLNRYSPQIALAMTDRDIVERASKIMGGNVSQWKMQPGHKKPVFFTGVQGKNAVDWMLTILPFMGSRRQAKINSVIAEWKPRNHNNSICGHLDRPHCAKGKCSTCYGREKARKLRARKRENL
jgi:hypothetical protein